MTDTQQRVHVLGVPMDLGQTRRGVDMGPSAIRYAGLKERLEALGHRVRDLGNIHVPLVEQIAAQAQQTAQDFARDLPAHVAILPSATTAADPWSLPASRVNP